MRAYGFTSVDYFIRNCTCSEPSRYDGVKIYINLDENPTVNKMTSVKFPDHPVLKDCGRMYVSGKADTEVAAK